MFDIRRREFIALFGAAAAWPLAARAQQSKQVRRIGVLMSFAANDPEARLRVAAFEQGLRDLKWVEGQNLRIEYRWADNAIVLRAHATELVRMAPDVILANSTPAMAALQEHHACHPDRVHAGDRSGRPRSCLESRPSGRQSHRIYHFRVLNRDQVAGDAQGDGAARQARRAHLQPRDGAIRRLVLAADRGRCPVLRGDANLGRRTRHRRARAYHRCVRPRSEWRSRWCCRTSVRSIIAA